MIRKRIFFNPQNYKNINQMIILRVCRRKSQKQKKITEENEIKNYSSFKKFNTV